MTTTSKAARYRVAFALVSCALLVMAVVVVSRAHISREVGAAGAVLINRAESAEAGPAYPASLPGGSAWRTTVLPDNWDGGRPDYSGYVWYRLALPAAASHWQRPAIYLPAAGMNAELWMHGERIGGAGRMIAPVSRHFYTPQLIELPRALLQSEGGELVVLLAGYPGYRSGLAPVWLGEYGDLHDAWRVRRFWQTEGNAATIVINMTIAAFVLLIGWRDREHSAYVWFASAAFVWALRNLNYWVTDPVIPDLLFAELCVSGAAWFTGLFAIFAMRFAESNQPGYRGPRWLPAAALTYAAAATLYFVSADNYARANAGFALLAAIGVAFTLWSMARLVRLAFVRPAFDMLAVACGAVIYLLLLLNDYAIGVNRESLGEIFTRQYASLPLFIAVTATLAQRYMQSLQRTRELAASLQSQVNEQRIQLERSFEQLREAEREQARAQERARVMGDLHDGLGMHLATALRQTSAEGSSREMLAASLQDCMDELRVAIDSLDEQERDPLALLGSLRFRMAPRFASLGVRLDWKAGPELGELPVLEPSAALHLLRVVQEVLSNALKHSGATVVTLSLEATAEGTLIQIADNGHGFDPTEIQSGRGLVNLDIRAGRIGAQLTWRRNDPGMVLSLLLPVRT